jgi:SAM-dependent methyltransferase
MDGNLVEGLNEAYNRHAAERDTLPKDRWKLEERAAFAGLMKAEGKTRLLEIGPGPGQDSLFFREQGLSVKCADASQEMVRLCRQKGLDAEVMDIRHLAYKDCSFEGVYAMNCLLHIPKRTIPEVLEQVSRVLEPGGLFFWGVYGGEVSEGIWEKDTYEPKRFFSFYSDEGIQEAAAPYYDLIGFHTVPMEGGGLHFQSLTLRKKGLTGPDVTRMIPTKSHSADMTHQKARPRLRQPCF